jgi:hypothetical protein
MNLIDKDNLLKELRKYKEEVNLPPLTPYDKLIKGI